MVEDRIVGIQIGMPKVFQPTGDYGDAGEWSSGIFKEAVAYPVFLGIESLEGDGQADLVHHGGPDRAVLVFSRARYSFWEAALGMSLANGSFGENLTVERLTEDDVCIGDIWQSANVQIEVSQPRVPCYKLSRRLGMDGVHLRVTESGAAGWYCRSLQTGLIQTNDMMRLVDRPHPEWTVKRAFAEFMFRKDNLRQLQTMGSLPGLSKLWKERILARIEKTIRNQ